MARGESCKFWEVADLLTATDTSGWGLKLSDASYSGSRLIAPSSLCRRGTDLVVGSYYGGAVAVTNSWDLQSLIPQTPEEPTSSNSGITASYGLDFGDSYYAIASYIHHVVRIYQTDGSLISTIGTPNTAGSPSGGLLTGPRSPFWLPNGNLLIGTLGDGSLSEWDVTGSLISTRLTVDGPLKITRHFFEPDLIWVLEFAQNRLLLINTSTWTIEDYYYAPAGTSIYNSWSCCHCSDDVLAVASIGAKEIVGINVADKSLAYRLFPWAVGASFNFRDVIEVEPELLAFTDWNTRGVYTIPTDLSLNLTYKMPEIGSEWEIAIEYLPTNFNPLTGEYKLSFNPYIDVPKKIIIPTRRRCVDG